MTRHTVQYGDRTIEYNLERKRVRNINLRVRRDGSVYVSASRLVPQSTIVSFVLSNAARIIKLQDQMAGQSNIIDEHRTITPAEARRVLTPVVERIYPVFRDLQSNPEVRRAIGRNMGHSLSAIGVRRDIPMPELRFRTMKSRWGSCNPVKGVITLNSLLVDMPEECQEYVVMHEFCHFLEANHSPRFHAWMTLLMPDWKERKKLLEQSKYKPAE